MSIKVESVSKFFGEQKALNNISFEVNAGEIVGFLGPNGAGKSTSMKIIAGFIPPSEGSVSVCGYDVVNQSLNVREIIGYLPESNPLYLEMYVKEYLSFVAGMYKLNAIKQRVSDIIDITGLGIEQHKKIGALSKGYRQRVGLAQVLIHNPQVLILDEPTSGLDPNQIVEIRNLIKEIGKEKTVLLSTHIMQEVDAICDRIIVINKGKIVAYDTKDNILKQKEGALTQIKVEFKEQTDKKTLLTIDGVVGVEEISANEWLLKCESKQDSRSAVFKFAVDKGLTVLSMQKMEKNLEAVFRELTTN